MERLGQLFADVRARFANFTSGFGGGGKVGGVGGGLARQEAVAVLAADRYITARLAGSTDELMRMVSSDVTLTSGRDGKYQGRAAFGDYLRKVAPTGRWERASWNAPMCRAEVRGLVKIVFVPVPVIAHFALDNKGKIRDIYVGKR